MNDALMSLLSEWFSNLPNGVTAAISGSRMSFSVLRSDENMTNRATRYAMIEKPEPVDAVLAAVKKFPGMTCREMSRACGSGLSAMSVSDIKKHIHGLMDAGLIRVERTTRPGGGHARVMYFPVDASE